MITERKPLGAVESNLPRIQPTRAAKTGHKWLAGRQQKLEDCENTNSSKLFQACTYSQRLALQQPNGSISAKENLENNNVFSEKTSHFSRSTCNNSRFYNKKNLIIEKEKNSFRLPLQTLAINIPTIDLTMDIRSHNESFYVSLSENSQEQSVASLSTENSDVSLRSIPEEDEIDFSVLKSQTTMSSETCTCKFDNRLTSNVEILNEYLPDILSYMRTLEVKYKPKPKYLEKQTEITPLMRTKLIDWLVEVQDEYKLHNETFYLAVAFVDRFLSEMSVTRTKLQLLGTASMFLAAKFEEIYPPDANEFAYVTADTYTRKEVLLMERMILKVFKCTLAMPTTFQYLTIFMEKSNFGESVRYLSYYIAEITLLDDLYLNYLPSVKAAAAITLAVCTLRHSRFCDIANGNYESQDSNDNMNIEVGLENSNQNNQENSFCCTVLRAMSSSIDEIYQCVLDMANTHLRESNSTRFVREKYTSNSNRNAATMTPLLADSSVNESSLLSWSNVSGMWL